MFFVLDITVDLFFCCRQVVAISICYKGEPLLVNVVVLHHIAVHPIIFDEVLDPCNAQKLVVIREKGLKIAMLLFQKPLFHKVLDGPN